MTRPGELFGRDDRLASLKRRTTRLYTRHRARRDQHRRLHRPLPEGPGQRTRAGSQLRRLLTRVRRPVAALPDELRGRAVLRERRPLRRHRARHQRRAPADADAADGHRKAHPARRRRRIARIPARLGGLRRPRSQGNRPLQPGGAAGAHRRIRTDRRPGDFPTAVDHAGRRTASSPIACSNRGWCVCRAACPPSVRRARRRRRPAP